MTEAAAGEGYGLLPRRPLFKAVRRRRRMGRRMTVEWPSNGPSSSRRYDADGRVSWPGGRGQAWARDRARGLVEEGRDSAGQGAG